MYCVIILAEGTTYMNPLSAVETSISFLPLGFKSKNLLTHTFSILNTQFSSDKIFIICNNSQYELVIRSELPLPDENIIVEPETINFATTVFFATLAIERIVHNEPILFFRADKVFKRRSNISPWLHASFEIAKNDKIVFPLLYIEKKENPSQGMLVIEAGKIALNRKNMDFFNIDAIFEYEESTKKRKMFGKQGKIVYSLIASVDALKNDKNCTNNVFFRELMRIFSDKQVTWAKIKEIYEKAGRLAEEIDLFSSIEKKLCVFVSSFSSCIEKFGDLLLVDNETSNFEAGSIELHNCNNCVVINETSRVIKCDNVEDAIIIQTEANFFITKLVQN